MHFDGEYMDHTIPYSMQFNTCRSNYKTWLCFNKKESIDNYLRVPIFDKSLEGGNIFLMIHKDPSSLQLIIELKDQNLGDAWNLLSNL